MYTISEAAKKIGVSRQSIYKKINKEDLQQYLQDSDKGKVINEKGFNILKGLYDSYLDSKPATDNEQTTTRKQTDNLQSEFTVDYIASLKAQSDHLKGIISGQADQINSLTRLLENSQVLLKQQQDKILMLEDSHTKKQSFWDRFRRN